MKVWECKVGPALAGEVPEGADGPMRDAVSEAFAKITGREPDEIFSGWGGEFDPSEEAVINNEEPDMDDVVEYEINKLREAGILQAVCDRLSAQ